MCLLPWVIFSNTSCHPPFNRDFAEDRFGGEADVNGPFVDLADQTTRTYKLDIDAGRVAGFVDETEAMKQAILKILLTERWVWVG